MLRVVRSPAIPLVSLGCLAALATLLVALAAHAQLDRTLLLIDGPDDDLVRRLRAEAAVLGWQSDSVASGAAPSDEELLVGHGADALVRVLGPDRVAIHVRASAERASYDTTLVRDTPDAAFSLAIVELIRGRLVEPALAGRANAAPAPVGSAEHREVAASPSSAERADTERVRSADLAPKARAPMLWATGGVGALMSGGFGTTPQALVGLRVEPSRRAWIATIAAFPIVENVLRGPEASADVLVRSFLLDFGYRFVEPARGFALDAGASAGLSVLTADVDSSTDDGGPQRTARAGMFLVRAGASAELLPWLCLRVSVAGGVSVPHPSIYLGGSHVATFGPALGFTSLSAEFGWPLGTGTP